LAKPAAIEARPVKYFLGEVRIVRKNTTGEVDCTCNHKEPCEDVVDTEEVDDYCWNHVSCPACKMQVENPNYKKDVGPLHWQGKASKVTGQDIRDFAYENS
jgi:hypothetical protein